MKSTIFLLTCNLRVRNVLYNFINRSAINDWTCKIGLFLARLSSLVQCLRVRQGYYPKGEQLTVAPLEWTLALFTYITLGWKGMRGTNTLAFYDY
jgi:hypothetical protein